MSKSDCWKPPEKQCMVDLTLTGVCVHKPCHQMLNIHYLFHILHSLKISLFLKSEFLVLKYLLITLNRLLVISKILYLKYILELSIAVIVMNIFLNLLHRIYR